MDKEFLHLKKCRKTWLKIAAQNHPHLSLKQRLSSIKVLTTHQPQDVRDDLPAFDKPDRHLQAFQRRFGLLKVFSSKTVSANPYRGVSEA